MKKYLFAALITACAIAIASCTASPAAPSEPDADPANEEVSSGETENADAAPEDAETDTAGQDEDTEADTSAENDETEAEAETEPEEEADPTAAWKDTYAAALWIYASGETFTNDCRFSLAYIDEDDIPELLIHRGSDHASGVEIYGYLDGGLINVSTEDTPAAFGAYGSLTYAEKGNRIASNYRAMGEHTCDMYRLDSLNAVKTGSYYDNEDNADDTPVYQIDGSDVTKDEYTARFDADNADLAVADYESAYEFTSENYVAVLAHN